MKELQSLQHSKKSVPFHAMKTGVIYDIGFGDVVTPSPIDLDYPTLPESLPAVNILAYSLKAVIAEKFHAVVELAAKQPHERLLRPISSAVKRKI